MRSSETIINSTNIIYCAAFYHVSESDFLADSVREGRILYVSSDGRTVTRPKMVSS